ncbi:tRNA 2-thiouridine(34) synthase MnmA [Patescibacteria group bacterium]
MFSKFIKKKHIVVALSGGVDSAVAAALVKNPRYKVTGVFMYFWADKTMKDECENSCCPPDAAEDARKIANELGIDFLTVDFKNIFKKEIVDDYIDELAEGRTPSPCVMCNAQVRLGHFLEWAEKELDADYIATGHYAQICKYKKRHLLKQPRDLLKDQTYFLYRLKEKQLKRILFPLGQLRKTDVRNLAREMGLPVHAKKDSQDLCWVGGDQDKFIRNNIDMCQGDIVDSEGTILGEHAGLPLYTFGQRRGINVTSGKGPYYVIEKNAKDNQLVVTADPNDPKLLRTHFKLRKPIYVLKKDKWPKKLSVRLRSNSKLIPVKMVGESFELLEPQRAVTPGQSAVFYAGKKVLGGGIID